MFARPRTKPVVFPPRKKRKVTSAIEEIAFDPNAREQYLSGFHKRELQRMKYAKEEAAKRDKEEKLTARKIICLDGCEIETASNCSRDLATRKPESRP
jgi:ribosomal RNA-processing protein 17